MQTKEDFFMEVKKVKWLKFISAIAIFVVMIFYTGLNVHAENVKDGISVTVSSNKKNYNLEDEINLKITVKNTNDFLVSDIKVENILPDEISFVSGDMSKDSINLQANEEAIMDLTVKKSDSGHADITNNTTSYVNAIGKNDTTTTSSQNPSPKTGENDTSLIVLIVMLISIVTMIICFWKGKKRLKTLSLFLCLGIVGTLEITGIAHAVSDNTQIETINSSDKNISSFTTEFTYVIDEVNYTHNVTITYYDIDIYIFNTVDKELQETIVTDTFRNSNLEERKEIALNLLNKLESEHRIKKGSIEFNEEYNSYFFEYLNGGEGSIFLEDLENIEDDNSIITNESNGFIMSDKTDKISRKNISNKITINDEISNNNIDETYISSFNNNSNGYIKDNLLKHDLTYYSKKALIIDDLANNSVTSNFNACKKAWTSNNLITDIKSNVTVEEFKTILNGYNFINIRTHGYIDKSGNPTVWLQEKQGFFEDDKYLQDRKEKRIGTSYGYFGGNFYLKSSFFSHYYSNKLIDNIVLIGCCSGYINDTLVSTFANECGAKAVIAPTDTIWTDYNTLMADIFVHKLLFGHTVNEALKEAKSLYGNNDEEYRVKIGKQPDNTPAELKIYNGGNETLVELVEVEKYGTLSGIVIDELGNPVKNAVVLAIMIRGGSYKSVTDDNGRFIINDCPEDSYQIGVSAEGYEFYQSDEFLSSEYVVLEGEEPKSVTIQLKKSKEYTEDELKEKIISQSSGNIVAWVYEDFDGNGTKEAFFVIDNGAEDAPKIQSIYFIDNKGNIKEMRNTFDYPAYSDSKYTICQGKGFFSVDVSGGGSAWKTYLFSVKDNNSYELDISGDLQDFYEINGIFYTTENNFNNGFHEYVEIELIYNSDTQQFAKGQYVNINGTDANWQNAYIEVLSNLNYSSTRFMTAYIDEDNIPELVVAYDSAHVAGCEIYTYYKGKVSKLESGNTNGEFGSAGEILYSPHKNLINSRYYNMGSNSDTLYKINNGNAQLECALYHGDYDTNAVRVTEFKIDGIEVTENEYWNKYNSYEIDAMVSTEYKDMVEANSTNISNYFNNINSNE